MQFKENKTLIIIFRICIFAAFFAGVMYVAKFFGGLISADSSSFSREEAFQTMSSSFGFFYAYLVFALVSFILSIVCFKTTSTVSSVIRTISLALTSIVLFLNMSYIKLFSDAIKVTVSDNYDQLMKLNSEAEKIMSDPAVLEKLFLSFGSVFVMLVLVITSVVALVKALKGKAKPADKRRITES